MEKIRRIASGAPFGITKISWFMETLAEIAAFGLAVLVVREVLLRYLFKAADVFSVETSEYLLVFICFMSIAWVLKENRHVRVEAVTTRLSKRAQLLADLVTSVLTLAFCSVVLWKAIQVMLINYHRGFRSSSLVSFPMWIPYFVIAFGILALVLQYLIRISERARALRGSRESLKADKSEISRIADVSHES